MLLLRVLPFTFTVLCALVSAYALGLYAATLGGAVRLGDATPPLAPSLRAHPRTIYVHALSSGVALFIVGLQMLPAFRRSASLTTHRALGYAYASCVALGSVSGAVLSRTATGGAVSTAGFALLAAAWASTTGAAVYAARTGRLALHARLMSHSAALCFAAVTLRMMLPAAIFAPRGVSFGQVYSVISWACWVPNVVAVELYYRFAVDKSVDVERPGAGGRRANRGPDSEPLRESY